MKKSIHYTDSPAKPLHEEAMGFSYFQALYGSEARKKIERGELLATGYNDWEMTFIHKSQEKES